MKKSIVITSIFDPTEAVMAFSGLREYDLIVVGDKKTPEHWCCNNSTFISVIEQEQMPYKLAQIMPYNHYCRKMLGYLKAIEKGAEFIVDTDDDNIPKDNWGFPSFKGQFETIQDGLGFINIYQLYTQQKIWPRGLPLHLINTDFDLSNKLDLNENKIGIWQGLADEDPDVDAIYRLTSDVPCYFTERPPVVLGKGTITPFNTQNTIIRKELFPLMYLPTYVTFRFTDILRGLVAQPIMWLYNYHLGFVNATVIQKRNPHDYMKDFISEIPMYQYCEKVIDIISGVITGEMLIEDNLFNAYQKLQLHNIVNVEELRTLEAWLNDLKKISKS
jgi:hypothetical protein